MPKEYGFEFIGTKEEFLKRLSIFSDNEYSDGGFYYFENYIVELVDEQIRFGIERAGHSGGYWFVPTITEHGDKIEFHGTIQYIGPENAPDTTDDSILKRIFEKIGEYLLYILLGPFVIAVYLIVKLCSMFKWVFLKILRPPTVKPKTREERLFDLMEHHLGCVGKL